MKASTFLGVLCIAALINQGFGLRCYECRRRAYGGTSGADDDCIENQSDCEKLAGIMVTCQSGESCFKIQEEIGGSDLIRYGCAKPDSETGIEICNDKDFCHSAITDDIRKKCEETQGTNNKPESTDDKKKPGGKNGALRKSSSWIFLVGVVTYVYR